MVRYADGPTCSVEIEIDAAPSEVWPVVSDINVPAQFSEEFLRAEWIDDGPALGATFRGFNKHPIVGEWDVECTVTAFDPEASFEWCVVNPDFPSARWRFDLESSAENRSRLRFTAVMGPGPSGLTPAIEAMPDREEDIIERRLGEWLANMERTVAGIAGLVDVSTA